MKKLNQVVIAALVLAAPVVSFAQQSPQPLTRAEVRASLIEAERGGYGPLDWTDYPNGQMQAAQVKTAVQKPAGGDTSGFGAVANGSSQSGDLSR
ncbi:DUF4148 domain-containing protein [Paraburkholderia sp.]|uniref:DUF4148 domain-containing protein n=1 Tax=Paraburkholderia sp. TaxID=1926495 RepID=UPI00286EE55A|nr:DUF4148 domain-containing protein [Paraburkholderia sp.]